MSLIFSYWWLVLILGGALVSGIIAIIRAARGDDVENSGKKAASTPSGGSVPTDGDEVAILRSWAEQNAATITRLQDQVDQLTVRLDRVEGILRDVD